MADEVQVTVVPESAVEIVEEIPGENVTETTVENSDAVAVAQIEGETAVAIAAISADTEQARIEADLERERLWQETNAEVTALRTNMQELERENQELRERLSQVEVSQSTPTPQAEELAEALSGAVDATLSEPNLTPLSTAENEPQREDGPSGEEENPEAVAVAIVVPPRKRRRLI